MRGSALDALRLKSEQLVSYLMSGKRSESAAIALFEDLADRLDVRPLIYTDALPSYDVAMDWVFDRERHIVGKNVTSYVERQNLTMRMGMRRFTRQTTGSRSGFRDTWRCWRCTSCTTTGVGLTCRSMVGRRRWPRASTIRCGTCPGSFRSSTRLPDTSKPPESAGALESTPGR